MMTHLSLFQFKKIVGKIPDYETDNTLLKWLQGTLLNFKHIYINYYNIITLLKLECDFVSKFVIFL